MTPTRRRAIAVLSWGFVWIGCVCAQDKPVVTPQSEQLVEPGPELLSRWIRSGSVQTGLGFRDNVILSHTGEERSSFVRSGVEATLGYLPQGRMDIVAVLFAEGTRYFSSKVVDHEAQAMLFSEWSFRVDEAWKLSLDTRGYYFDEIYDVSDTELLRDVAEVKTAGFSVGPKLRWTILSSWWLEAQATAKRDVFPDGINNRRVHEGRFGVGWHAGKRFHVSAALNERRRFYDRRLQNELKGRLNSLGRLLRVAEREPELKVESTLDGAGRWKMVTRGSSMRFTDNGPGYLNYRQSKIANELEWTPAGWTVALEGAARRADYDNQTVGDGIAVPPRIRENFSVQVRLERQLSASWTALAKYSWERNRSNDLLSSYYLNEGLLGLRWNWEK